jgi:DNA-binding response OmpR family regulator
VHLLIVEDDDAIAAPLARGLEREGFSVSAVTTGAAALAADGYDMVLLDLGMPDMDGLTICRELRARSAVPILIVTARGDEADRVVGLELGADDYLVKPFGFRELVARIRAVTRRTSARVVDDADVRSTGALVVDLRRHRVTLGDTELTLTPKEFDLVALLAEEPGTLFTRTTILERVWDPHWYGPTKTLDVHVASVRKKLGDPRWIETVRGVGFRLVDPAA